jgi:hypothetical protein
MHNVIGKGVAAGERAATIEGVTKTRTQRKKPSSCQRLPQCIMLLIDSIATEEGTRLSGTKKKAR